MTPADPTTPTPRESPTDFLIRCMEEVEGAEDVILIYRKRESNDVVWFTNEVPRYIAMGLLAFVQTDIYMPREDEEREERE